MTGLSPAMMGALVGAVFGLVNFFALRMLAERLGDQPAALGYRRGTLIMVVAWADLALLTVIGYFVGPLVLS